MRAIYLLTAFAILGSGDACIFAATNASRGPVLRSTIPAQASPKITQAFVAGKQLIVVGENFGDGAEVRVDGKAVATSNDPNHPTTFLISKKGARKVLNRNWNVTLQVQNPDGLVSDQFTPVNLITVTLADDGKTITVNRQDSVFVFLGSDLHWNLSPTWDQSVLSPVPGVMLIQGAQALLKAAAPGQTTLSLTGGPPCRDSTPPCEIPSRSFSVTIVVQ
jgi:hypothetical protein